MAQIVIMPQQGNTVESCIITNWKVKEGDCVNPETIICEIETDKAAFELAAGTAGTVLKLFYESGDDVPVLRPIAVIGEPGEDWKIIIEETSHKGTKAQREEIKNEESIMNDEQKNLNSLDSSSLRASVPQCDKNSSYISPRAKNLAAKNALPVDSLPGTGPGGRIIERDVTAALQNRPPLTVAARTAAGSCALPVIGSGLGGRITLNDLAAQSKQPPSSFQPSPASLFSSEGAVTETPVKGIRKIIAERMKKSLSQSAQFTLNASASAVKLQAFRCGAKLHGNLAGELGLSKTTINDLILFVLSRTLPRFPYMNAHKTGDTIKIFERVHFGLAVDTAKGLMVPVIRNANLLSLAQISLEAKRLAAACQNGSIKPDELAGSTFTVSNLGSFGITCFTPVLNEPEVAILGVCGIELKPVMQNSLFQRGSGLPQSQINFEPHIAFSLTINHEAVDGAPAARFLKAFCEAVAHIDLLLAAA